MKIKKNILIVVIIISIFSVQAMCDIYAAQEYGLIVNSYSTYPSVFEPGDKGAILRMNITHYGSRTYNNIKIKIEPPEGFAAIQDTALINSMDRLDKYTVQFKFDIGEIEAGTYIFPVIISYNDSQGGYAQYVKHITIQVSSTPSLEISKINYLVNPVIGNHTQIAFTIKNTEYTPASNINAKINIAGSEISWVPNQKIISQIPAKGEAKVFFTGTISKNAAPGSYKGNITLTYNGKTLTNPFIIDLIGEPDLKIAGVSTSNDVYVKEKTSLSVQIENVGEGDAESVKVMLLDADAKGIKTSYIGKIEYDDTGTAIFDLSFNSPGEKTITAKIEYTDSEKKEHELVEKFELYVNKKSQSNTTYIMLIIAIAIAAYYFNFRKKKEQLKKVWSKCINSLLKTCGSGNLVQFLH